MLFKAYIKNRRKLKILLLLMIIGLIVATLLILNSNSKAAQIHERIQKAQIVSKLELPSIVLKSPQQNGVIVPEKYDEHKIKTRLIQEKLKEKSHSHNQESGEENHTVLDELTKAVHIFYSSSVNWYKAKKLKTQAGAKEVLKDNPQENELEYSIHTTTPKPVRTLNTAFYPLMGLYKPTEHVFRHHLENIKRCGVGVLILSYKSGEFELYKQILELVPQYNMSITFELSVASNQSMEYLTQQLATMKNYSKSEGFYKVYSQSRGVHLPLIYISNAYKLSDTAGRLLCKGHPAGLRRQFEAFFVGHIRLKTHADTMRRLCFDGFYSKLPSNGATFASTWKNWSYLKSFALTYKMLFIPTVGPGFAERNKFPRHGDIQRHRSNGRYYGVAWRTGILNHVGFINIASYNNFPDGSQIEEVIPKAGFLDYSPLKYIDLTTHWVGNFLKARHEAEIGGHPNCYELLNNTIC